MAIDCSKIVRKVAIVYPQQKFQNVGKFFVAFKTTPGIVHVIYKEIKNNILKYQVSLLIILFSSLFYLRVSRRVYRLVAEDL